MGPITWETTAIRHYLNHDFFESFDDKHLIVEVLNTNPDNTWYKTPGGNDTLDKVFLLSMDELVRYYFGDSSHLLDYPLKNQRYWFNRIDENNVNRRSLYLNESWWYWTRTMGKTNKFAVYSHYDGNVGIQGNGVGKRNVIGIHPITKSNCGGIRPALWLKID